MQEAIILAPHWFEFALDSVHAGGGRIRQYFRPV